jgi:Fic family protein
MIKENSTPTFKDIPLVLPVPKWNSELAKAIVELEQLRVKHLGGPVPPHVFFQLKIIFQMMESLGSAHIEGNRTTLAEFVEKIIEGSDRISTDEKIKEIKNVEDAILYVEKNVRTGSPITRALISDVHKIIVDGLTPPPKGEGSHTPGYLRNIDVIITKSTHKPPEHITVASYFDELLEFVNKPVDSHNDLLLTAIAHHRMTWIHPFDNGNGRLVRVFTYALLIKQGFKVQTGRILNPTAIFCLNRDRYTTMLRGADTGEDQTALDWCSYVLDGLRREIEKIDNLLDRNFLNTHVLKPTLSFALERKQITDREFKILSFIIEKMDMTIKSSDIDRILETKLSSVARSRIIKALRDKEMLVPLKEDGRIYTMGFVNNYLLRGVFKALEQEGFVPASLNKNG